MNHHQTSDLYDPDLPTASAVLASLSCVAVQYVCQPSLDLAKLAVSLANKLTAPEYAETPLISVVAKQLVNQWGLVVSEYQLLQTQVLPTHSRVQ